MRRSPLAFVSLLFAVPAMAGCLGGDGDGQPPSEEGHPATGLAGGTDPADLPPYGLRLDDPGYRLVRVLDDATLYAPELA